MSHRSFVRQTVLLSIAMSAQPAAAAIAQAPSGSQAWQPFLLGTQVNVITQHLRPVPALYSGPNSLGPRADTKTSQAYGIYAGLKVTPQLQAYLDAEMIRGSGISHTVGLAGLTNGDVIRQGSADLGSGPYVARAFLRYTVPLFSMHRDTLIAGQDQVPMVVSSRRIELTAGKLAASDLFDLNRYANSTRTQFMNWGLFQNTAWDFAADTRGYTNGVAAAWITPRFSLRAGSFQMPTKANGNTFDSDLRQANGNQAELTVNAAPTGTVVRVLGYLNEARMGNYADALAIARASGMVPDITADDRPGRVKYGFGLNLEQPLFDGGETGLFARAGWSDGKNESFAFTEVDRHLSAGAQISAVHWGRPSDRLGVAFLEHGIVVEHQAYLAAGGTGFLLGDGALTYGSEQIVEAYYRAQFGPFVQLTPDVQYARNPAYNRARGPATIAGMRANLRY
jgi:high affinity Mn2+ porin